MNLEGTKVVTYATPIIRDNNAIGVVAVDIDYNKFRQSKFYAYEDFLLVCTVPFIMMMV